MTKYPAPYGPGWVTVLGMRWHLAADWTLSKTFCGLRLTEATRVNLAYTSDPSPKCGSCGRVFAARHWVIPPWGVA